MCSGNSRVCWGPRQKFTRAPPRQAGDVCSSTGSGCWVPAGGRWLNWTKKKKTKHGISCHKESLECNAYTV